MEIIVKNKHGNVKCLIDEEDAHFLEGKWVLLRGQGYLSVKDKITKEQYFFHRLIMGAKKGQEIDHINRNKLDNRKENLRFTTRSQNNRNKSPSNGRKYKGINWHKGDQKWRARYNNKFLGNFDTEIDAAIAYDIFVWKQFVEITALNFPEFFR